MNSELKTWERLSKYHPHKVAYKAAWAEYIWARNSFSQLAASKLWREPEQAEHRKQMMALAKKVVSQNLKTMKLIKAIYG